MNKDKTRMERLTEAFDQDLKLFVEQHNVEPLELLYLADQLKTITTLAAMQERSFKRCIRSSNDLKAVIKRVNRDPEQTEMPKNIQPDGRTPKSYPSSGGMEDKGCEDKKENKNFNYYIDFKDMIDGFGGHPDKQMLNGEGFAYFKKFFFFDLELAKAFCRKLNQELGENNKNCGEHFEVRDWNTDKFVWRG